MVNNPSVPTATEPAALPMVPNHHGVKENPSHNTAPIITATNPARPGGDAMRVSGSSHPFFRPPLSSLPSGEMPPAIAL